MNLWEEHVSRVNRVPEKHVNLWEEHVRGDLCGGGSSASGSAPRNRGAVEPAVNYRRSRSPSSPSLTQLLETSYKKPFKITSNGILEN